MSGEFWIAAGSLAVAALSTAATWTIALRAEAGLSRRHAAERLRTDRLAAYAAFLGYARTVYRSGWTALALSSDESAPNERPLDRLLDLAPGHVNGELNDLAAPIRLLSPSLAKPTDDVIVGISMFLLDVRNRDMRAATTTDPAAELRDFESAAAADLADPPPWRSRWAHWVHRTGAS